MVYICVNHLCMFFACKHYCVKHMYHIYFRERWPRSLNSPIFASTGNILLYNGFWCLQAGQLSLDNNGGSTTAIALHTYMTVNNILNYLCPRHCMLGTFVKDTVLRGGVSILATAKALMTKTFRKMLVSFLSVFSLLWAIWLDALFIKQYICHTLFDVI